MSTVRFLFHFSHIEAVCYLSGVYFPQMVYPLLLYSHHYWKFPYGGITYLFSNSVAYLIILRIAWAYIRNYVDCPDDLIEHTEAFRSIVKERSNQMGWHSYFKVFKVVGYPLTIIFSNEAITSTTTKLFLESFPYEELSKGGCITRATFYGFGFLGVVTSLFRFFRSHRLIPYKYGANITILLALSVANIKDEPWFKQPYLWHGLLALFSFQSGNILASATDLAMQMVDDRKKKQAGFLVFIMQCAGFAFSNALQTLTFVTFF